MSTIDTFLDAAATLSAGLSKRGIRHAFYGDIVRDMLQGNPDSKEICCIVESAGMNTCPFRRVRDALQGVPSMTANFTPWSKRLHVVYTKVSPPIRIEILPSGETGPLLLDDSAIMMMRGVPFLNFSELIRARLKSWMIGQKDTQARDIIYFLQKYWRRIDINRIPEADMSVFLRCNTVAAPAWLAINSRYTT
ncbi:hypothetical protein EV122DRAFT_258589 [Schizophyllum commune]|nr:hypothetical protein K525DRAFT_255428 [Schizophyllum commune Loenen D]